MLTQFKRLGRQVFVYGLGDTINKLIGILIIPLFTRYLAPSDYGVFGVLTVAITLLVGICDFGLTSAISRFYHDEIESERLKMISTAQIVSVGITIVIAAFVFIFAQNVSLVLLKSAEYAYVVKLSFLTLPLNLLISAPLMKIRFEEKAKFYATFNIARVILGIILNAVLVVFLGRGLNGLFESLVISLSLQAIFILIVTFRGNGFNFSKPLLKKMLIFGYPFILSSSSIWIIDWADRFILARLTDLSEAGLYSLGYNIGMGIMLPVGAFAFAWTPFFMSVAKKKNARKIYSFVGTYYALAIGFFVLILAVFCRDYFLLTPTKYQSAYNVTPLIAFSYAVQGFFSITAIGAYIKKRPLQIILVQFVAMVVNMILMFLLIPKLNRMGAAWATFGSYLSMSVLMLILSQKFYPIRFEYRRIIHVTVVGLGLYFLTSNIFQPSIGNLILRLGLILTYPIILLVTGFFNLDEKKKIKVFGQNIINILKNRIGKNLNVK